MRLNRKYGLRFISLSVLVTLCIQVSGQNITLNLRNTPVSRAVTEIQKMYGYSVVIKSEGIDLSRQVSVNAENEDLKTVLAKLFEGQDVVIDVNGNNVFISKRQTNTK